MITHILGGAFLPHAPQFFTMPDTEDKATVARVRAAAAEIGERLRALKPDLWILFSNDHAEQFFHNTAPPFTIHTGAEASGEFAGRQFRFRVPGEIALALVRLLYEQGFDPAFSSTAKVDYAMGIPLTHLNHSDAVLPIYVNAYLPPQPPVARCYAFGQAIARAVTILGLRAVVLASGGMSHFPGTNRYANPELDWDRALLERIGAGNLKALAGIAETELDDKGNIELRCWACAAGALGERKPDILQLDPSWHHNYASVAFFSPPPPVPAAHYPEIAPELVELTSALHGLAHDDAARKEYAADPASYAAKFRLNEQQCRALVELDVPAMVAMGAHPLIPFLANMQIQRIKAQRPPSP